MTTYKFVFNNNLRMRLDSYLSNEVMQFSRNRIQKLIAEQAVTVNGDIVVKSGYELKNGDIIVLEAEALQRKTKVLAPVEINFSVIYEDSDLLVINKPTGISVHPSVDSWEDRTIAAGVLSYLGKDILNIGDNLRPGIVHRLDKDTSGVLVIAKNADSYWNLTQQFKDRKVKKEYIAVVKGHIEKTLQKSFASSEDIYKLILWIQRNPKNPRKYIAEKNENGGRYSETDIKLLNQNEIEEIGKVTTLKMFPKTGRTHQLRVVAKLLDSPIIGDTIYGGSKYERLMLHATRLTLHDLKGQKHNFEAKLPKEFALFL